MKFDMVHDIQKAYRKVINGFAYPTSIISLQSQAKKWSINMPCFKTTQIIMSMLLDADTTCAVITKNTELVKKMVQLTYCPVVDVEKAKLVFVTRDMNDSLIEIIEKANLGTLEDPQLGATIFVECDLIENKPMYLCKGPGIKDKNVVSIEGVSDWLETRNNKNIEFPLGVDLVFIDRQANCVVFPRTTQVERM